MFPGGYGSRYLEAEDFVRYCKEAGVEYSSIDLLEKLDRLGWLNPVCRLEAEEELIRYVHPINNDPNDPRFHMVESNLPQKWLPQYHFIERVESWKGISPHNELCHPFDRTENSKWKTLPSKETFRPWRGYNTMVRNMWGYEQETSYASHYYSYWQLYQLKEIIEKCTFKVVGHS